MNVKDLNKKISKYIFRSFFMLLTVIITVLFGMEHAKPNLS